MTSSQCFVGDVPFWLEERRDKRKRREKGRWDRADGERGGRREMRERERGSERRDGWRLSVTSSHRITVGSVEQTLSHAHTHTFSVNARAASLHTHTHTHTYTH